MDDENQINQDGWEEKNEFISETERMTGSVVNNGMSGGG
jgi:hypothetical protein